ncbi:MAG: anaerobic ribonucleoside-triphosphate reductase [Promethearchaeota archaeon]
MDLLPKVFRTEGDWVEFDPSKIFESIQMETGMTEADTKKITELVVRRIISSGIKFLSGPHIREIVCSILSEQHFEEQRKLYTRIGMPLMDYEEILEKGPKSKRGEVINPEKIHHWAANQLAEEYTLLRILNDEESKAHLYGDIHIHKLKYFDLRPLSQAWDPRMILKNGLPPVENWPYCSKSRPAEDLRTAIHHLVKWLAMSQGEFSGGQGFNFVTTFLAPYAKGLNQNEINHNMHELIYEINQLAAVIGRDTPITSISCSPGILDIFSEVPAIGPHGKIFGIYGDYINENIKLFDFISKIFTHGDNEGNEFNYPKHIIYINKDWLEVLNSSYSKVWEEIKTGKNVYIVNLCAQWVKEEIKNQYEGEKIHNIGTLQNISLNLPRYAYISKDQDKFIEILKDKMKICIQIFKKKYEIIEKRLRSKHLPLCSSFIKNHEQLFKLENQNLAFNFIGLNETIKFLTNYELHEHADAFEFGKKIIHEMKKFCEVIGNEDGKSYVLQENLSNKVLFRFKRLDLKHFPETTRPLLKEVNAYYTNSSHFRKNIKVGLMKRISQQGEFHEIMKNGLNIVEISLNEVQNIQELIKTICGSSKISCIRFKS